MDLLPSIIGIDQTLFVVHESISLESCVTHDQTELDTQYILRIGYAL